MALAIYNDKVRVNRIQNNNIRTCRKRSRCISPDTVNVDVTFTACPPPSKCMRSSVPQFSPLQQVQCLEKQHSTPMDCVTTCTTDVNMTDGSRNIELQRPEKILTISTWIDPSVKLHS